MKLTLLFSAMLISVLLAPLISAEGDTQANTRDSIQETAGSKSTVKQPLPEVKKIAYARLGEQIRKNKVDVGSIYSVSDENGRFHNIHADKLLMDCSQCHGLRAYKADYLLVSKYKKLPAEHRGRVEKAVCLGCHLPGGMGTPWYGGSTIKEQTHE